MPSFEKFNTFCPVYTPNPVEKDHPLNQGRVAWWLATPPLDGGKYFYDLMGLNHGKLNDFTPGYGWNNCENNFSKINLSDSTGNNFTTPIPLEMSGGGFANNGWTIIFKANVLANQTGNIAKQLNFQVGIRRDSDGNFYITTNSENVVTMGPGVVGTHTHALVQRPENGNFTYYRDGFAIFTISGIPFWFASGSHDIQWGYNEGFYNAGNYSLPSSYKEISFFSLALSANDIAENYEEGLAGYPKTLRRLSLTKYFLPTYQGSSQLLTF